MKLGVLCSLLIALPFASRPATAQDLRVRSLDAPGRLDWTNPPAGHVCFVEHAEAIGTEAWSNAALSLKDSEARVEPEGTTAFYRILALAVSNLVHYPLTNDANDALGYHGPMDLNNTPFAEGGIYCNGVYSGDVGGSSASTPSLPELNFNGFIIAVEFKAVTNTAHPILVGGDLWRWGGAWTKIDGTVGMFINAGGPLPCFAQYQTGVWHEIAFVYTAWNTTAELYMDGRLADRRVAVLNHQNDDDIHNTHYGSGQTFKGYLRNLRVWNIK